MDKTNLPEDIRTVVSAREKSLDRIRGCLFGGACGDALGYPVEFKQYEEILEQYGASGITSYSLDPATGLALFSDDTQMSLFTANGLLFGQTRASLSGITKILCISGIPRLAGNSAWR